jgi:hypothetical protein
MKRRTRLENIDDAASGESGTVLSVHPRDMPKHTKQNLYLKGCLQYLDSMVVERGF